MRKQLLMTILILTALISISFAQEGDQQFEGFNLQGYNDDGQKAWDVKGDTANIVGTEIELSNVNAVSYGKEDVNVTADRGSIEQMKGNMHLQDDVVVTSGNGSQLMTDSLYWNRDDDLVTTEDDVIIIDDKITVTGTGMEAQPGLKSAVIQEDVTVTINTEEKVGEKKFITVTCDGSVEIDQVNAKAVFNINVVAVQEDQILKADTMEIYFNEDMSDISKMVCIGNVVIEQGENQTFAEKAVYDAVTKKLVLSGRPKLILLTEGENAVTAIGN